MRRSLPALRAPGGASASLRAASRAAGRAAAGRVAGLAWVLPVRAVLVPVCRYTVTVRTLYRYFAYRYENRAMVEYFGCGGSNSGGRLHSQPGLTDTSTQWSATAGRHFPLGGYCSRAVPDCLIRGRLGNGGSIGMRPRLFHSKFWVLVLFYSCRLLFSRFF